MKRLLGIACVGLLWTAPALGQTPTAAEKKATAAWVQSLQQEDGGFAADGKRGTKSSLPATAAALRAFKYFGGEPKDRAACAKFVSSCYQKDLSAYALTPTGKPDTRSTAFGLMAAAELKLPAAEYMVRPVVFLCSSVKKVDDIRIAAAAYEAVKSKCELASDWIVLLKEKQNQDGTYGTGKQQVQDTAQAVVALMRLGAEVEKHDKVVNVLKAGQLPDGGWGKAEGKSDLETTYRVMRALVMLKERPDIEKCRKFVASCRNEDGSYGLMPGEAGLVSATYFAGIIHHWLEDKK